MPPKTKNALLEKMQSEMAQSVKPESTSEHNVIALPRDNVKKKTRKPHTSWYPPTEKVLRELKILAIDEKVSENDLIVEGLRLMFEKRGKHFDNYL